MPRILVKLGELQVEYDGDQKFISDGLLALIKDISTALDIEPAAGGDDQAKKRRKSQGGISHLSTSSIAQKMSAKSGPELATAAAGHLTLKGQETFTHTELIAEMRGAKTFYKNSFHKNLGSTLKSLVGTGRFNHLGGNNYALSQSEKEKIEALLA